VTEGRVRFWWAPPLMLLVVWGLSGSPDRVEKWYSRGMYPGVQRDVTGFSNLTTFAWLDVLILGAAALVLWRVWTFVRVARSTGLGTAAWDATRRLVRATTGVALAFLLLWGLNYRRVPLDVALGTPAVTASSTADLRKVLDEAGVLAAQLRPSAVMQQRSFEETSRTLLNPLNRTLASLRRPGLFVPGTPKVTLFTPYFTWAGIDGMSNPFGLESIVQPGVLPFERPFVLAHEWAHLAGHADEAEASAIGWLACMHGDAAMAYSASVYLILELAAALPGPAWEEASRRLDPGVLADVRAVFERFRRTQPVVRRAATRVYDEYLRANGVTDGVQSYGRALSLILLPRFRGWLRSYPGEPDAG